MFQAIWFLFQFIPRFNNLSTERYLEYMQCHHLISQFARSVLSIEVLLIINNKSIYRALVSTLLKSALHSQQHCNKNRSQFIGVKASLKRYVLSLCLKQATFGLLRISMGRGFQRNGATLLKALSLYILSLVLGSTNRKSLQFHKLYVGNIFSIKSHRYEGVSPSYALKVSRRILKFILNFTGSQCRLLRSGLMCSNLFVPVTPLAAAFWAF